MKIKFIDKNVFYKSIKILSVNLLLILFGIIICEIFLKFKNNSLKLNFKRFPIPNLVCNRKVTFDISHLYKSSDVLKSIYIRDSNCYRSFNNEKETKKVLVVGGSTTDQSYVTEGETFQDILDNKLRGKYDFINAGVDGQSSYGHLFSLENWHKKVLEKNDISQVIFYIGVNDIKIAMNDSPTELNYSLIRRIKDFLNSNSVLYVYLKSIKYNFEPLDINKVTASHSGEFNFFDNNTPYLIKDTYQNTSYQNRIKSMIQAYQDYFNNSEIIIIQQQIPGCKFINKFKFIDRHSKDSKLCTWLANVYLQMDDAIDSLSKEQKSKLKVVKMYLENILNDEDVYDALHTNKSGSAKIANYILKIYQ